ncbi:GAF and ANTAR domain-containing protein [Streptomyces sp. NPDC046197]|uniref:GAF and ANTAR domain-containing protein n=1 Tax=Streptomyces sp. NPDC046197 TaxID=3154337 RepID=UPI0033D84CAF
MRPEDPGESESEERRRIIEAVAGAAHRVDARRAPELLCRACMRLLPVSGASVSLSGGPGVSATWCASNDVAFRLAEVQYTLGDGPCQTALDRAAPVLATDLTRGPDVRRWPVFAHEAVGLGVRAVFSLPLGVGGIAIGTLDLYRDTVGALSESELRTALWARDAVTFALLNLRPPQDSAEGGGQDEDGVASWVDASEADHTEVYEAVGMVMVQLQLDPDQALDRLRARAFAESRTVTQVAKDVLARRLRFESEPGGGHGRDEGRRQAGDGGSEGER